jgi:hypothetical protein
MGIYPSSFTSYFDATVGAMVQQHTAALATPTKLAGNMDRVLTNGASPVAALTNGASSVGALTNGASPIGAMTNGASPNGPLTNGTH